MKRDFKFTTDFAIQQGLGIALVLVNMQPKKKYHTSDWNLVIIFLCFGFSLDFSYRYFYRGMPKTDNNKSVS